MSVPQKNEFNLVKLIKSKKMKKQNKNIDTKGRNIYASWS